MPTTPPRPRRLVAAAMAAALAVGLAACGGDDEATAPAAGTAAPVTATSPATPETTPGAGAGVPESTPEGAPPGVDDAGLPSGEAVQVPLAAQNGSGQSGTATLISLGEGLTRVVVRLDAPPPEPQPAHLHKGTCAALDPNPAFPLTDVRAGMSETFVPTSLASLRSSRFAVNVHRSAAEAATYVACGDVPAS